MRSAPAEQDKPLPALEGRPGGGGIVGERWPVRSGDNEWMTGSRGGRGGGVTEGGVGRWGSLRSEVPM